MLSTLIERFLKGVDDAASAATVQAHLEMLKNAAEILEKNNENLEAENKRLRDLLLKMEHLEQKLASLGV